MSLNSGFDQTVLVSAEEGRLIAFLKYSNVHILLVAFGLMAGTYVLTGIALNYAVLLAGCCGAFLVYQLDRCLLVSAEDEINQPARVLWVQSHQIYIYLSIIFSMGVGGLAAVSLTWRAILWGCLLAVLGVLYLQPVFPGGVRPKSSWYLKPLFISGAWSLGSVLLPVFEAGLTPDKWIVGLVGYRFLFILPNVLLTDWLDRAGDELAGFRSIAMFLREKQLRILSSFCVMVAITVGLLIGYGNAWPAHFYVDMGGLCLMLLFCIRPLRQSYLLYGLALDLVISWPLATLLATLFF